MRVILDENIPNQVASWFPAHVVTTVQREGLSGTQNGRLVELIDQKFDVFVTADKNLRYQQNLSSRHIGILELPTNRLPLLLALKDRIISELDGMKHKDYQIITL